MDDEGGIPEMQKIKGNRSCKVSSTECVRKLGLVGLARARVKMSGCRGCAKTSSLTSGFSFGWHTGVCRFQCLYCLGLRAALKFTGSAWRTAACWAQNKTAGAATKTCLASLKNLWRHAWQISSSGILLEGPLRPAISATKTSAAVSPKIGM